MLFALVFTFTYATCITAAFTSMATGRLSHKTGLNWEVYLILFSIAGAWQLLVLILHVVFLHLVPEGSRFPCTKASQHSAKICNRLKLRILQAFIAACILPRGRRPEPFVFLYFLRDLLRAQACSGMLSRTHVGKTVGGLSTARSQNVHTGTCSACQMCVAGTASFPPLPRPFS